MGISKCHKRRIRQKTIFPFPSFVNWNSNFAVQTQVCATHLPCQLIYLLRIWYVQHRSHSKAQLLVQHLRACYHYNYAFLKATSNREINLISRADRSIHPRTSSVSAAAITRIPKSFYLFSPSNKLNFCTSLIYSPVPHVVTRARQFCEKQAFIIIPNCLLQPHHE